MVFDHIGFKVTDFPKTKDFRVRALQPLGMGVTAEGEGWAMIGRTGEGPALVRLVRRLPGPDPHCLCRQDAG